MYYTALHYSVDMIAIMRIIVITVIDSVTSINLDYSFCFHHHYHYHTCVMILYYYWY